MKKYLKCLLIVLIAIPFVVRADSGLDVKYEDTQSVGSALLSGGSSFASAGGELLGVQPGDDDYNTAHIVISIVCIIIFLIVTCVYLFKLIRPKTTKKKLMVFVISLIPTLLFSLLCLLTKVGLAIYIFFLILYVIIYIPTILIIIAIRLNIRMKKVKEIDKDFTKEEFGNIVFNNYKDIQIAWMNMDLDKVKDLISKDIYNDYKNKLKELKNNNQKNIMDGIEYKKNKIKDIKIDKMIATIECELSVTCIDYIINNEDKVIKGNKDKTRHYLYRLVFDKELNTKKCVLIEKTLLKEN